MEAPLAQLAKCSQGKTNVKSLLSWWATVTRRSLRSFWQGVAAVSQLKVYEEQV